MLYGPVPPYDVDDIEARPNQTSHDHRTVQTEQCGQVMYIGSNALDADKRRPEEMMGRERRQWAFACFATSIIGFALVVPHSCELQLLVAEESEGKLDNRGRYLYSAFWRCCHWTRYSARTLVGCTVVANQYTCSCFDQVLKSMKDLRTTQHSIVKRRVCTHPINHPLLASQYGLHQCGIVECSRFARYCPSHQSHMLVIPPARS